MNHKKVILLGTMDTKGNEYLFLKDIIEGQGISTITIDISLKGEPLFVPTYTSKDVIQFITVSIEEYTRYDKSESIDIITRGAKLLVGKLVSNGDIGGIISLGGTNGTYLATSIMKELPFGLPKIMVSTVASGDTKPYIGHSDIIMFNTVTDIAGINHFSREILSNSALSLVGIVKNKGTVKFENKPMIAATMMGVTTPCITEAKRYLEDKGYEIVIFHANGNGGKAMEEFILKNEFVGVLDLTTCEIINELSGSSFSAGSDRLSAAVLKEIPQVVSLGALDMIVFGDYPSIPQKFKERNIIMHNPAISLVRTNLEENFLAGKFICTKLNRSLPGKTTLLLPLKGFSIMDVEGKPFFAPEEDRMLIDTIKEYIDRDKIEIIEVDCEVNDPLFARTASEILHQKLSKCL